MSNLGITSILEKLILSQPECFREYVNQVLSENLLGICSQALITNPNGTKVPVHEILIPNKNTTSILAMGKYSQIRNNISTSGAGSFLFDSDKGTQDCPSLKEKVSKGLIDKPAADAFLEYYKASMA